MLLSWMPVPGTTKPEPIPVDAEREAALPRASITLMCVVDGIPAGSLTGTASPARIRPTASATRSSASRRRASPPRKSSDAKLPSLACAVSRAVSASRAIASTLPGAAADPKPVDQPERVGDQHSAGRRRRIRDELMPSVTGSNRPSPHDPVRREILLRELAAAFPTGSDDCRARARRGRRRRRPRSRAARASRRDPA